MAMGRPKAELVLSDEERQTLERWARRPKSSQQLALRSRIVLACCGGRTNQQVAKELRLSMPTVGKWRARFVTRRLDGLLDEPRPGTPRTISDEQVEKVITKTLETKPQHATHWSTRGMAKATGLSQTAISRIWRAFNLQPHRTETFKLSTDPQFIEKVRDVVGLYMNPPDRAIVLCVDEKSQVQALDRSQPLLPSRVERWRGGLGVAYLCPALSFAGASLAAPCSVSTSRSSNRACEFPAHGSPTGFSRQHAMALSRSGRDTANIAIFAGK
jgi:transposase